MVMWYNIYDMKDKIKKVGDNKYKKKKSLDIDDFLTVLCVGFMVFVLVFSLILKHLCA